MVKIHFPRVMHARDLYSGQEMTIAYIWNFLHLLFI